MVTINLGEESSICSTCSECLSPFLKFSRFCHAVSTGDSRVTESDKSAGLLRVAVVQRPELETNRSSQKIRYASSFSTSRSI